MSFHSFPLGPAGSRNARRRRLLAEESSLGGATGLLQAARALRLGQPSVHKSDNYGDAEFLVDQSRLIDLVPRRLPALILPLVMGLAAVAGLAALYVWTPDYLTKVPGGRVVSLDLAAAGSLAAWFSSLLLLAAAVLAVAVYSVRRHRLDDYQGHYRIWLWAASCWLLVATDVAASLHDAFRELLSAATGTRLWGDGSIWWAIPAVFLFGAVGSRLLVDMRSCRLSSLALLLAAVCYAAALAGHFGWGLPEDPTYQVLAKQGALLVGHLLVLLAMGLHARYVLLDAEGLLPRRQARTEATASDASPLVVPPAGTRAASLLRAGEEADEDDGSESPGRWVTIDPPHGKAPPALRRVGGPAVSSTPAPVPVPAMKSAAPLLASTEHKLTKVERKALKKRLLEERLHREQQKSVNWGK